jgi:hypothetical protein
VADASIGVVLPVLNDHDRFAEYFKPLVVKALLLQRNGDS